MVHPKLLRVPGRDLAFLMLYGLILCGFNATWMLAVAFTGASLATVLVNASGAFTVVLAWRLLGEKLSEVKVVAVLLSMAGCVLISHATLAQRAHLWGIVMGVASALCYAAYSLFGRRAAARGLNPWTVVLYTFFFSGLFLFALNRFTSLPGAAPQGLWHLKGQGWGWFWLWLLAAGPTVMGFGLYNSSLRYLPSSVANLIVTAERVVTFLIAYPLFGERLTLAQCCGSALILGGVGALRFAERQVIAPSQGKPSQEAACSNR